MVLTRHEVLFKQHIDAKWTFLVYTGLWIDPLREDLEGFITKTQERVTGKVRLKMYKGGLRIVGRSSSKSLYDVNLSNHDIPVDFKQSYAEGFIDLWGMPSRIANILKMKQNSDKN